VDHDRSEARVLVAVVVALTGLIGLLVGATMLMSYSMVGSMMGSMEGFGPIGGAGWWAAVALVVAGALGITFAVFSLCPYHLAATPSSYVGLPVAGPYHPASAATSPVVAPTADDAARAERLLEATVVKALDEDERGLYLRIREAGGQALQRNLVASGAFSKARLKSTGSWVTILNDSPWPAAGRASSRASP